MTSSTPTPIVLQRGLPRGDLEVDVKRYESFTLVNLAGRIAETFDGEALGRRLIGKVVLDTREVDKVTSFGVRSWLAMLQAADADELYFARCSEAVLSQMAMIRAFTGSGRVVSFFAPYLCESCGNPFRVLYDAVGDRERIRAADPLVVPCPRCATLSTLDDDPEHFFAVPSLLDDRDEALNEALARLAPLGDAADPIEKSVRKNLTLVRFNSRMDAGLRLGRVFEGLEGRVVFDLSGIPEVSPRGADTFVRALKGIDPAVTRVHLTGCPAALADRLAKVELDGRVNVVSVVVNAICTAPPRTRAIFVDLTEHVERLVAGLPPVVRCDWCDDTLDFTSSQNTLTVLAKRLSPPPAVVPPAPSAARGTWIAFALTGLLASSAVVFGGILLVGLALLWALGSPLPVADSPPEWADIPITVDAGGARAVGEGEGDTVDDALKAARLQALGRLADRLNLELRDRPVFALLATRATDEQIVRTWTEQLGDTLPQRGRVTTLPGDRPHVYAEYILNEERWSMLVNRFREEVAFRGLLVGPRPLTLAPSRPPADILVVEAPTWMVDARPGDGVLSVGTKRVYDLPTFRQEVESQWEAVPVSGSLQLLVLTSKGERRGVAFKK